jgi:hypothetical protein
MSQEAADDFAKFFGWVGAIAGALLGLEAGEASGEPFFGFLGGGLVGGLLGAFVGHVVWRLILVGLSLLLLWVRIQACSAM